MTSTENVALVLLLFLGSFCYVHCQEPQIVDDIFPEVKRIGETARLNCTVARLGPNTVQWSFKGPNGVEVISIGTTIQIWNEHEGGYKTYEVEKIPQDGDRITFRLTVMRLQPEYHGVYECAINVATVDPSKWDRKTATITVLQPPIIRPGATDAVKLIEKGDNTTINCDAVGVPAPNITWVRSDGLLLPNGKAIFRGAKLPITFANVIFSGVYKCVADNNIRPPATSLTQVYVFQEPTVRVLQDSVGQLANGQLQAKLDCIVQGYPTPSVQWMFMDGKKKRYLTDTDKYETTKQVTDTQNLYNGEQWYTLTINYVQALDFGDYFCVGNNSKGEGSETVTLFETTECQGPLCYSMDVGLGGAVGQHAVGNILRAALIYVVVVFVGFYL